MIILVTGCAGFIGSHLCEKLLEKNINVYGIDNINDYYDIGQKEDNLKLLSKYKNFSFRKDDIITTNIVDEVALTGYGKVPGVDYSAVGPGSQFEKNTYLTNNFPEYSFNSKIPSLNFIGNTLGRFGYETNTKFFQKNSIGGKINPATGKPFGYGIDGYNDYMEQRLAGNVGAYGGTELSQNEINKRAAQGDSTQGVMNIDVSDMTDDTTDDTTIDDFFSRYLQNQPEDIRKEIEARMQNYYTV